MFDYHNYYSFTQGFKQAINLRDFLDMPKDMLLNYFKQINEDCDDYYESGRAYGLLYKSEYLKNKYIDFKKGV